MGHIAVLDVGKTNKKVRVYDDDYHCVEERYVSIPADESGEVDFEKTEDTARWFLDTLAEVNRDHPVDAVAVSTHGATWVGLDEAGELALPVIAYTTDPGEDLHAAFYKACRSTPEEMHDELFTPNLGALANLAKGIFFARHRFPDRFAGIRTILHYPQYFGHLLTATAAVETTYTGCHSYLWDYRKAEVSRVADALEIREMLPAPVRHAGDRLGTVTEAVAARTGLAGDTVVSLGIHDSNASLLPLLIQIEEPFVLNSTGTWCVAMAPGSEPALSESEMRQGVFFNCDAFGRPVKTSIFMGGQEHDTWLGRLRESRGLEGFPDFDADVAESLLRSGGLFFFPGVMPGTGPFPDSTSRLRHGQDEWTLDAIRGGAAGPDVPAETLYLMLNASLAVQSAAQLSAAGLEDGMPIVLEGGFRKNRAYQAMLQAMFPHSTVKTTDLEEATAFGAALTARAARDGVPLSSLKDTFAIGMETLELPRLPAMPHYAKVYAEAIGG